MKKVLWTGMLAFAASVFAAGSPVSNVTAKQHYPWNGLVDIGFTITSAESLEHTTTYSAFDAAGGTNLPMRTILKPDGTAVTSAKEGLLPGTYVRIWNAAADLPEGFVANRVQADVSAVVDFPYTVKFNANGGTGTMANETYAYGTAKKLTANAFTRDAYIFKGWATSASGAVVYANTANVSNLTQTARGTVNLYAVWKAALYMVVDLSGGTSSTKYPVSYLESIPSGGWTDTYKTTKLVLRRCEAGKAPTGSYTLTKPFFIGVFEMTQKQWNLVMGTKPSSFSGDTLPVEWVSYNTIRGETNGAQWPSSSAVDATSFIGKIRTKTGLSDFDLPTVAQWEFACRAGTTTTYSYGNSANGDYMWYTYNSSSKTHTVGTKKANPWGLYDMHGNVWEWCLDWYGSSAPSGSDPKGSSSGSYRVLRGGSWNDNGSGCTSSYRYCYYFPSCVYNYVGFRLVRTLSK